MKTTSVIFCVSMFLPVFVQASEIRDVQFAECQGAAGGFLRLSIKEGTIEGRVAGSPALTNTISGTRMPLDLIDKDGLSWLGSQVVSSEGAIAGRLSLVSRIGQSLASLQILTVGLTNPEGQTTSELMSCELTFGESSAIESH